MHSTKLHKRGDFITIFLAIRAGKKYSNEKKYVYTLLYMYP